MVVRLRTKIMFINVGVDILLALIGAMIDHPSVMCIALVLAVFSWLAAHLCLDVDVQVFLESLSKQEND